MFRCFARALEDGFSDLLAHGLGTAGAASIARLLATMRRHLVIVSVATVRVDRDKVLPKRLAQVKVVLLAIVARTVLVMAVARAPPEPVQLRRATLRLPVTVVNATTALLWLLCLARAQLLKFQLDLAQASGALAHTTSELLSRIIHLVFFNELIRTVSVQLEVLLICVGSALLKCELTDALLQLAQLLRLVIISLQYESRTGIFVGRVHVVRGHRIFTGVLNVRVTIRGARW